jgi:adenylate cyclase
MMSAEIILQLEGKPPSKTPIGQILSIGRGPGNDLVLDDNRASRSHAVIRLQGDKLYYLLDLGSSNGTLLNGRRVTIPSPLKGGDQIQIANTHLLFAQQNEAQDVAESAEQPLDMRTQVEFTSEMVSILVIDIRNYTGLSEGIPAEELSRIVGKWFQDVSRVIESKAGSIDKFIGDAVMAYWIRARTEGDKNFVLGPIRAALELIEMAKGYDQQVQGLYPQFKFAVGCGINSGRAILGNVGVDNRRDVTAVGDCVNVAFRVESLCRELGHTIILSDEVKLAAGAEFNYQDLGPQKIKGKSQELKVYTIKGY